MGACFCSRVFPDELGKKAIEKHAFYIDEKEQRFQYVPVTGLDILFRPKHYALVGIIFPDGCFQAPLEMAVRFALTKGWAQ